MRPWTALAITTSFTARPPRRHRVDLRPSRSSRPELAGEGARRSRLELIRRRGRQEPHPPEVHGDDRHAACPSPLAARAARSRRRRARSRGRRRAMGAPGGRDLDAGLGRQALRRRWLGIACRATRDQDCPAHGAGAQATASCSNGRGSPGGLGGIRVVPWETTWRKNSLFPAGPGCPLSHAPSTTPPAVLATARDAREHGGVPRGVAHDAAARLARPTSNCGLTSGQAVRAREAATQRRQDERERDERDVDDDERRTGTGGRRDRARAFTPSRSDTRSSRSAARGAARIRRRARRPRRAALQQAVGEAAGRGADVEAARAPDVDANVSSAVASLTPPRETNARLALDGERPGPGEERRRAWSTARPPMITLPARMSACARLRDAASPRWHRS